jgi:hypothetical protein
MDLTTLVSGHLTYLGLGSPPHRKLSSIELQAPVWRLGKKRQLAQQMLSRIGFCAASSRQSESQRALPGHSADSELNRGGARQVAGSPESDH